jgi:AmmeMemoRadiSam system protein A
MLSDDDRCTLLRLARDTLEAAVGVGPRPPEAAASPALRQPCGCFVTLHNAGRLRGCIGTFAARAPLCQTVVQMARAALRDPRFLDCPVTADELKQIDIEISVLSPLERTKDPMAEVELGRHGIWIEGPYGSGCFLPQVAAETGWSKEEFFGHCCVHKAGLPADAWKWPETAVYRFEAEVFGEKDTKNDKC